MSELTKLEKKLAEMQGEGYCSELRGLDKKALEFKLLEMAKHREEIVTTKNMDEEYQLAREKVKELNAPYSEQMKHNKIKTRFLHLLLKEKYEDQNS
jgi:hypothetical protein